MSDEQFDLFGEHTRSRTDDPWTSKAAAKRIMRSINDKHRKVQEIHRQHQKGLTDWELEEICRDHGATYRTRRQELSNPDWFKPPYIVNSGKTKRCQDSDHPETERIVWIWAEYADPTLLTPLEIVAPGPRPSNAHYDEQGRLQKTCATCGAPDPCWGSNVAAHKGQMGMWFCYDHRPR